jgi:hypothetical protein
MQRGTTLEESTSPIGEKVHPFSWSIGDWSAKGQLHRGLAARMDGNGRRWVLAHEFNVLALVKGQERYIFVYDDDSRPHLIDAFRDQAADPELSLNWFDAMVLTNKAREQQETPAEPVPMPRSRI